MMFVHPFCHHHFSSLNSFLVRPFALRSFVGYMHIYRVVRTIVDCGTLLSVEKKKRLRFTLFLHKSNGSFSFSCTSRMVAFPSPALLKSSAVHLIVCITTMLLDFAILGLLALSSAL